MRNLIALFSLTVVVIFLGVGWQHLSNAGAWLLPGWPQFLCGFQVDPVNVSISLLPLIAFAPVEKQVFHI